MSGEFNLPHLPEGYAYGNFRPADGSHPDRIEVYSSYTDTQEQEVTQIRAIPISELQAFDNLDTMVGYALLMDGRWLE